MTKQNMQRRLLNLGFSSHYSGNTKTFYLNNCGKYFQCLLFSDIELLGFNIVKGSLHNKEVTS